MCPEEAIHLQSLLVPNERDDAESGSESGSAVLGLFDCRRYERCDCERLLKVDVAGSREPFHGVGNYRGGSAYIRSLAERFQRASIRQVVAKLDDLYLLTCLVRERGARAE